MISGLYPAFDHWHKTGTVWLYSDPHFGDKEMPDRLSDEEQIRSINSKVGKKDTLIILGDIGDIECVKRLRGYKVLITGNHDSGVSNYKRKKLTESFKFGTVSRDEVIEKAKERQPGYRPIKVYSGLWGMYVDMDNGLFDEIYTGPLIIGEKIILSHEPVDVPWAFNLHGHVHNPNFKSSGRSLNLCSELIDYTPVSLNKLAKDGFTSKIDTIHRIAIDKAAEGGGRH